jgi:hypothetical protein
MLEGIVFSLTLTGVVCLLCSSIRHPRVGRSLGGSDEKTLFPCRIWTFRGLSG